MGRRSNSAYDDLVIPGAMIASLFIVMVLLCDNYRELFQHLCFSIIMGYMPTLRYIMSMILIGTMIGIQYEIKSCVSVEPRYYIYSVCYVCISWVLSTVSICQKV